MRKGAKVKYDKDGSGNFQFSVDCRDDPIKVMEVVDAHLKDHGLEIVTHESDADYYGFTIRKIRRPAAKKVKVHPLTAESLKQLGVGLKMFGEYTFGDKGPHEVMDVDALADKYRVLPATAAAALLLELYKSKEHKGYGRDVACSIICSLQDWPELFECPEVANEIDW